MKRMSRCNVRTLILTLSLIILVLNSVYSQATSGGTFLRMTVGSRAQAMGEAFTALAQNATGMYFNPAGMGFSVFRELMIFHAQLFEDIALENISFLYPLNDRWTLGAGISYLHLPELVRYEIDPVSGGPIENGTFSAFDLIFSAGMGLRLSRDLSFGSNFKFFQEKLESVTASGFAMDLGLLIKMPINYLSLGFSVQNLGPRISYIEAREKLPLTYRAGLAYQLPDNDATLAFDMVKTRDKDWEFMPGLEIGFFNSFYLRGGYQMVNRTGSGMTAGFGVQFRNRYKINYVYAPFGDLGDTHRAELIFTLGMPPHSDLDFSSSNKSLQKARGLLNSSKKTSQLPGIAEVKTLLTSLPIPQQVEASRMEKNRVLLSWRAIPDADVSYNVYVKVPGNEKWIRVTSKPIKESYKIFKPQRNGLKFYFAVTAVIDGKESDFSRAVYCEIP